MGWGAGDEILRKDMRTRVSLIKRDIYVLRSKARLIVHDDKGPRLKELADRLYELSGPLLDELERQLER